MRIDPQHPDEGSLLRYIDHELPPEEVVHLRAHLASCLDCRQRHLALMGASGALADLYRAELRDEDAYEMASRERLQQALGSLRQPSRARGSLLGELSGHPRLTAACLGVLVLALAGLTFGHSSRRLAATEARYVPDRSLTPGAVRPVSLKEVCSASDDDLDPAVTPAVEKAVLKEYGVGAQRQASRYQIDYLINPQLGGTSDIKNLWPEPASDKPWNAQAKDDLERQLHRMVCDGSVDLSVAQRDIATDWIAAYRKYIGATHSASVSALAERPKDTLRPRRTLRVAPMPARGPWS